LLPPIITLPLACPVKGGEGKLVIRKGNDGNEKKGGCCQPPIFDFLMYSQIFYRSDFQILAHYRLLAFTFLAF